MARKKLTQKRANEILEYDQSTGILYRKETVNGVTRRGERAGGFDKDGYGRLSVDGYIYAAHRVIWLMVYGYFPEHDIAHINRVKGDNRICNLREVTRSCNLKNTGSRPKSKSKIKGIGWFKRDNAWRVRIHSRVMGFEAHLGCYEDFVEAVATRLAVEQCLNWHSCDVESEAAAYMKYYLNNKDRFCTAEDN